MGFQGDRSLPTKLEAERDLLGDILAAIRKRGIKTMVSFHHERTERMYNGLIRNLNKSGMKGVDILNPDNASPYWFLGGRNASRKTVSRSPKR